MSNPRLKVPVLPTGAPSVVRKSSDVHVGTILGLELRADEQKTDAQVIAHVRTPKWSFSRDAVVCMVTRRRCIWASPGSHTILGRRGGLQMNG